MDKPTEWLITALKNPEGYDAHDLCGDAAKKIEELEEAEQHVKELKAELRTAQAFHKVAINQRDAANKDIQELFKQNMKQLKTICQFGGRIKELEQEVKDALAPSTNIINKKRQLAAFNGEDQG